MDGDEDDVFEIDDDDDDDTEDDAVDNPVASAYPTPVAATSAADDTGVAGKALLLSPGDLPIEEEEVEGEMVMGSDPYNPNDWGDLLCGADADEAETRRGKTHTVDTCW